MYQLPADHQMQMPGYLCDVSNVSNANQLEEKTLASKSYTGPAAQVTISDEINNTLLKTLRSQLPVITCISKVIYSWSSFCDQIRLISTKHNPYSTIIPALIEYFVFSKLKHSSSLLFLRTLLNIFVFGPCRNI